MTEDQVCDLLADIAAFDRRTIGDADADAWGGAVGDLDYADARAAVVTHYRESREWIMPADVRRGVREIREARLRAAGEITPPDHLADRPAEALAWRRRAIAAIASGRPAPLAIEGTQ